MRIDYLFSCFVFFEKSKFENMSLFNWQFKTRSRSQTTFTQIDPIYYFLHHRKVHKSSLGLPAIFQFLFEIFLLFHILQLRAKHDLSKNLFVSLYRLIIFNKCFSSPFQQKFYISNLYGLYRISDLYCCVEKPVKFIA